MKRRRSRQGLPEEAAPEEEAGAETPELDELRSLVAGLEQELAAERDAHGAARERAEADEALVAETRKQAEDWVEESRGFMEQRVAEAQSEVESERSARAAAEQRLEAMMAMEADARSSREEHTAAASEELDDLRSELARERELRLELEQRLDEREREAVQEAEPEPEPEPQEPVPVPDSPAPPQQEPVPPAVASVSAVEGCSVCGRTDEGRDPAELVGDGWAVEGEERVCPRCREAGWQLAPGVDSPFRRYSDRRPSGQSGSGEEPARTAASQTSDR